MAYSTKLRSGSFVLLGIGFLSWVIALGGLGATTWMVCSDTENTLKSIVETSAASTGSVPPADELAMAALKKDVAFCSRSWRWEWWTLFFQLAVTLSAVVATCLPDRLPRARYPLANMFSIASVLIMVALNSDIMAVWEFWDEQKAFDAWQGVLRKLYMSAAALVAGWIITVIMNLIYIGFTLDTEAAAEGAAPITGPEAARKD